MHKSVSLWCFCSVRLVHACAYGVRFVHVCPKSVRLVHACASAMRLVHACNSVPSPQIHNPRAGWGKNVFLYEKDSVLPQMGGLWDVQLKNSVLQAMCSDIWPWQSTATCICLCFWPTKLVHSFCCPQITMLRCALSNIPQGNICSVAMAIIPHCCALLSVRSTYFYSVVVALSCLQGNICSAEMARDLTPDVKRRELKGCPYERKKALLCMTR
eukprot:scaffold11259_cov24-Tisochrysis_lutea.AAC.6